MKKFLLYLAPLCLLFASCAQKIIYTVEAKNPARESAPAKSKVVQRDGKCFKNCIAPDRYETRLARVPVYTGTEADAPVHKESFLIAAPKTTMEVNRNGEKTIAQAPAVTREIQVLSDTLFYHDFRYEVFNYQVLVEKGGQLRETEVVCSDERTPVLYRQVSNTLKSMGYLNFITEQWSMALSEAIQQFQKDHGLSVGDLSRETLEVMGI